MNSESSERPKLISFPAAMQAWGIGLKGERRCDLPRTFRIDRKRYYVRDELTFTPDAKPPPALSRRVPASLRKYGATVAPSFCCRRYPEVAEALERILEERLERFRRLFSSSGLPTIESLQLTAGIFY